MKDLIRHILKEETVFNWIKSVLEIRNGSQKLDSTGLQEYKEIFAILGMRAGKSASKNILGGNRIPGVIDDSIEKSIRNMKIFNVTLFSLLLILMFYLPIY